MIRMCRERASLSTSGRQEDFREHAGLVVGWNFDDVGFHYEFERQFTTWTSLARKGVGHLKFVADDIVQWMGEVAAALDVTMAGLKMGMVGDVVDLTEPKKFARSVFKSLKLPA